MAFRPQGRGHPEAAWQGNEKRGLEEDREARMSERARIEFLIERDGLQQTTEWVRRTMHIYRRAVLDKRHFAHAHPHRLRFIVAYLEFKRWLRTGSTTRPA